VLLAVGGAVIVGNVDYVIRPMVFRRWANIHPARNDSSVASGRISNPGMPIGPPALSYCLIELVNVGPAAEHHRPNDVVHITHDHSAAHSQEHTP